MSFHIANGFIEKRVGIESRHIYYKLVINQLQYKYLVVI